MSTKTSWSSTAMQGVLRRRLLVNAIVDPDEAATRLPPGVQPHVTGQGTVVGCCLLEIEHIRLALLPRGLGRSLRATAHRISAAWVDGDGNTVVGVYVPVRHTDSRLASAIGGRLFPGVHGRAQFAVSGSSNMLRWQNDPLDPGELGIRVAVSFQGAAQPVASADLVGVTCLGAAVGVSPDHRGRLEAARMDLSHHDAREVNIEALDSPFIDSFDTAERSTSHLMSDVDVVWTRAAVPALAKREPKIGSL